MTTMELVLLSVGAAAIVALFTWMAARNIYDAGYEHGRHDAYDAAHDPRRLEVRRCNDAEWEALQERARKRGRGEER